MSAWLRTWTPVALYAAAIVAASALPAAVLPGGLLAPIDKLVHAVVYAGLGFLVARGLSASASLSLARLAVALAGLVAFAISDEIHQSFTPGRDSSAWDVLADGIGIVLGMAIAATLFRRGAHEV